MNKINYPAPQWQANSNGNSMDELKNLYMDAHRTAMDLRAALQGIHAEALHDRNYQTVHYDGSTDRQVMVDMHEAVRAIEEHCIKGASRLIRQREGL